MIFLGLILLIGVVVACAALTTPDHNTTIPPRQRPRASGDRRTDG